MRPSAQFATPPLEQGLEREQKPVGGVDVVQQAEEDTDRERRCPPRHGAVAFPGRP